MGMFRDRSENQQLKQRMKSLSRKIDDTISPSLHKDLTKNEASVSVRGGSGGSSTVVTPKIENGQNESRDYGNIIGSVGKELADDVITKEMATDNEITTVIAIVGLGGVGKTTIARKIYDDERTVSAFKVRLWVCVSKDFTDTGLLSSVITAAGGTLGGVHSRAELQRMLAETIRGKRFLLVLDDVWNSGIYLDVLKSGLHGAAVGSRVLVTARSKLVATEMGAQHIHAVEPLNEQDALSLLYKALGVDHDGQDLESIAKAIVHTCKSIPLAIRIMGVVLRTKQPSVDAWRMVYESGEDYLREIPEGGEGVTLSICLAYVHLPPHLKQCFLYCCSLFPVGSSVRRRTITELWISEGLVQRKGEQRPADIVAHSYYTELVSRNLLQPLPGRHDIEECTVHSLVQSFAQHLTKDEILAGDLRQIEGFSTGIRRLSISNKGLLSIPEEVDRLTSLRTFLLSGNPLGDHGLSQLFRKLKLLRVLDLSATAVEHIPDTLGDLQFIRHLDLSKTKIRMLPDSLKFLRNLALLDLKDCSSLHSLPEGIQNLYNLQYLDLEGTALEKFPQNLENLGQLRLLHGFVIDKAESCRSRQTVWPLVQIERMKNLTSLQLNNVERATEDEAKKILDNKKDLKELQLCCGSSTEENHEEGTYGDELEPINKVFNHLCPPEHLHSLEIRHYYGKRSPDWLSSGSNHLRHLQRLVIIGCKSIGTLAGLNELPELRFLTIVSCVKLKELQLGGTSKIEELYLTDMPSLDSLSVTDNTELQALRVIRLEKCHKIIDLPAKLNNAGKLESIEIRHADTLEKIKDIPALQVLVVKYAPKLREISGVGSLNRLTVIGCDALDVVQPADTPSKSPLSHVHFKHGKMKELPHWLEKHASRLKSLRIVGRQELLDNCYFLEI